MEPIIERVSDEEKKAAAEVIPAMRLYMVVNQENGKINIGQTKHSVEHRWKEHIKDSRRSDVRFYFHDAIRKHGPENFTIKQIDRTESEQEANELEKLYIGIFQSYQPEVGYNLSLGGDGVHPNQATRDKLSKMFTGSKHPLFGKHHTKETRLKMSLARKGKKFSQEHKENLAAAGAAFRASLSEEEKQARNALRPRGEKHYNYGKKASVEARQKMSASHKGIKTMLGKKHSEEAKRRMSLAGQIEMPINEMLKLRNSGQTYQRIANLFGFKWTTVYNRIKAAQKAEGTVENGNN